LKIGIFDSGLGGLTVVKALKEVIQNAHIYYVADTINAPYGEKTPKQILQFSLNITQYLIQAHQIDVLVLACNTATSFAIKELRRLYPSLIIIGTEPGIRPAMAKTKTGKIGILATPATLKGDKYQKLVGTLLEEKNVQIFEQACKGLVEQIELGEVASDKTRMLLEKWLLPMVDNKVDTIVLGCTHYPLVADIIEDIMQRDVTLIETGMAIAEYLLSLSLQKGHQNKGNTTLQLYATGEINTALVSKILNENFDIKSININYK